MLVALWLKKFKVNIEALSAAYLEKCMMQEALAYTLNNWGSMTAFMDHADLTLVINSMSVNVVLSD